MRRARSLFALGITFALAAAEPIEPTLILTSIKAIDVDRANKDKWSVKGYINDPDGDFVPAIGGLGLSTTLVNGATDVVNDLTFDANDCNELKNDEGVICKTTGTRVSIKRTNRVPKDATIEAQRNRNTTSASSYYRFTGVFRRQEFDSTLASPLTAVFGIDGSGEIGDTTYKCKKREGARATKLLCTPGAAYPTPAPSTTPPPPPP